MKNIVYSDSNGQEMRVYINKDVKLYICCGEVGDDVYGAGYICLDKEDVEDLITDLSNLLKEM